MTTVAGCPSFTRGTIGSGTKTIRPRVVEIGDDDERRPAHDDLAGIHELLRDDAGDRRDDLRVGERLVEHGDLRVGGGDSRARRVDLLGPRALLQPRHGFARAAHALRGAALPLARHVHSRLGIVALLLRAGVGLEQRLEAIQIELRRLQIGLDRRDVRLGGIHLRLGLANVLDARAGLEQPQLRHGGGAIGAAALNLQLGVARVELSR